MNPHPTSTITKSVANFILTSAGFQCHGCLKIEMENKQGLSQQNYLLFVSDATYDDPSYKQKHCAGFHQAWPGQVLEEHPAGPGQEWDVLHAGPDQVQEHKD